MTLRKSILAILLSIRTLVTFAISTRARRRSQGADTKFSLMAIPFCLSWHGVMLAGVLLAMIAPCLAQSCIVVDSDAGLDDYRAVSALAPTGRLSAVIVTEGISRSREGAGGMEAFLKRSGLYVPVLTGASASPRRVYVPKKDFPLWRDAAERLNGLRETVAAGSAPSSEMLTRLADLTSKCPTISLVVIGPWTSFMGYAPELLDRIDRIVAQGRPYPDELGGEPTGFNCTFDINSCLAAHDLLVGRQKRADRKLRVNWVDIPNTAEPCGAAEPGVDSSGKRVFAFSPSADWAEELSGRGGAAAVIAAMLRANPAAWAKTSLWDDLTALFLLRPEVFAARGGHQEPCVPAAAIRDLLVEAISGR